LERGNPGLKGWQAEIDWHARVGGFGPKRENRAAGARFLRTNHGGPLDWVKGTYLGRGRSGFKGQEVGIDPHARVGGFEPKIENQAAGARFLRTNCGGCHQSIEETSLWRGKPGLRGWEVEIGRRARVGGFWPKNKTRAARAWFS